MFAIIYLKNAPIMEAHAGLMSGASVVGKKSESHFPTVYDPASAVNCKAVKTCVE